MNFKTGVAITLATSLLRGGAQNISKNTNRKVVETVLNDTVGKDCSNIISYKDFVYSYVNTDTIKLGKLTANNTLSKGKVWTKPANYRKPQVEMANAEVVNADKTRFGYDKFGNVNAIYSTQGNKTRSIVRDSEGNLCEYTNISYKNGQKHKEEVFDNRGVLTEKRVYHGNERATVTNYDDHGNPQFEGLYKTEKIDGEEIVPGGCGCYFE